MRCAFIILVLVSFLHAEDFLKGVTAKDLAIAKEVEPSPEDTAGSRDIFKFYYNTANEALHPSGKLRAEVRTVPGKGRLDGIYVVNLETGKEFRVDEMSLCQSGRRVESISHM